MSAGNTVTFHSPSYVCNLCGQTVPANYVHFCPNNSPFLTYPQLPNYNAEILAELRVIRELLEKMHTQKTG